MRSVVIGNDVGITATTSRDYLLFFSLLLAFVFMNVSLSRIYGRGRSVATRICP